MAITKDTLIIDVMQIAPQSMPMFQAIGMHCMGCAMANRESVAEACAVHGVDADEFVAQLNKFIVENK